MVLVCFLDGHAEVTDVLYTDIVINKIYYPINWKKEGNYERNFQNTIRIKAIKKYREEATAKIKAERRRVEAEAAAKIEEDEKKLKLKQRRVRKPV